MTTIEMYEVPEVDPTPALLVSEAGGCYRRADDDELLRAAQIVLIGRARNGSMIDRPEIVKQLEQVRIASLEREVFEVIFLDSQHRLIAVETMFQGTVNQTSVYPREVAKRSLELNAVSVILAHNHPSGSPEPSVADEHLTSELKSALSLVGVRVLDHLVVTTTKVLSMAERGLV